MHLFSVLQTRILCLFCERPKLDSCLNQADFVLFSKKKKETPKEQSLSHHQADSLLSTSITFFFFFFLTLQVFNSNNANESTMATYLVIYCKHKSVKLLIYNCFFCFFFLFKLITIIGISSKLFPRNFTCPLQPSKLRPF